MTQVISMVTQPKTMTPAPSTPVALDNYDRPKSIRGAVVTPDSSPSPRSPGLVRKRAASINTSDASYAKFEQLNLNTPSSMSSINSDHSKDLMCLCPPAPKIPRPRNAFILYRQHHQAKVVAQNPTLSNPEISKIIGEQWKDEAENIKDEWKGLAGEEKQRHAQQYPDYRYQPRRSGKGQNARLGSSPSEDGARCTKCNGRSIATPRTPSTPFPTPTAAKPGMNPYTPVTRSESEQARYNLYRYSQHPRQDADEYEPESPDMKRRRFNGAGNYHSVASPDIAYDGRQYGHPARTQSIGGPLPGRGYGSPLPDLGPLTRSRSGPMPPPPRPGPWENQGPRSGRHATFDESLRLPPLQTSVPMSPSVAAEVDVRQLSTPIVNKAAIRDPQARSVEAMVMSIPFLRKLSVLSKISQPLVAPHPTNSAAEKRGAIVSIDGPKPKMLQQVGQVVERALLSSNEVALRTWANEAEVERRGSDASQSDDENSPLDSMKLYAQCFQTALGWHDKSKQIVDHVLRRTTGSPEPSEGHDAEEDASSRRGSTDSAYFDTREKTPTSKVPVALLKEGFSLTLSDKFACTVPITDSYAPVDHWQWMATLWRGIVGPDLVIYVKPSTEEETAKCGTVDFQKQPGLIVVRIPFGKDLDEATERRVAFEVIEWMRGGSFREAAAKS